jgi:hypothetical protein
MVYVPVRTFGKFSHGGTYRYIPVRTVTKKTPKVRTSTYKYVLFAIHGNTWQYMTVHGSTWQYIIEHFLVPTDSMLVRTGTSRVQISWLSYWILRLKFCPAESADFADSAGRYTNACTNRFIHLLPLPEALAPFSCFAAAGCSAAAGGSGAAAGTSAAAGVGTGVCA